VNLDALIPREYFEAAGNPQQLSSEPPRGIRVTDFEKTNLTYLFLRKPEFQRETSDWGPSKVADLIYGFLDGDLIPSIILWRSPTGNIFVIDGAHRVSAFVAWVNDDYGDKEISRAFFNNRIPEDQIKAAQQTRTLIESQVGSYNDLKRAAQNQTVADPSQLRFAQNLAASSIGVQWVVGDATTAERSFFKINQEPTPIDQTELTMIKERRKPQALATRALMHAGTGHNYWSAFDPVVQREITELAREIYDALFRPDVDTPLRTLDVPVAGKGYSPYSPKLIFELVKYVNRTPATEIPDDSDGVKTLDYLRAVRRAASLISGQKPQSLGLHPHRVLLWSDWHIPTIGPDSRGGVRFGVGREEPSPTISKRPGAV
jgi:hypothetical protein